MAIATILLGWFFAAFCQVGGLSGANSLIIGPAAGT